MGEDRTPPARSGRHLKTAAEALTALRLLGTRPGGITSEILAEALGKSAATARYLLNTLCQEGYAERDGRAGTYRLTETPPWGGAWGDVRAARGAAGSGADGPDTPDVVAGSTEGAGRGVDEPAATGSVGTLRRVDEPTSRYELPENLADAVTELYGRTRQRSYLARWEGGTAVIVDARGHQGLARIPDLGERIPLAEAHALAVTKALAATSSQIEELVLGRSGRHAFTATTITTTPGLARELARVRRTGVAVDREEFAEGFCCLGAPILAPDGRVAASIAVSSPAGRFASESAHIAHSVREVAAVAMREWRERAAADRSAPMNPPGHSASHDAGPTTPDHGSGGGPPRR